MTKNVTHQTPTEPGFYWVICDIAENPTWTVAEVGYFGDGELRVQYPGHTNRFSLQGYSEASYRWSSRIPTPDEYAEVLTDNSTLTQAILNQAEKIEDLKGALEIAKTAHLVALKEGDAARKDRDDARAHEAAMDRLLKDVRAALATPNAGSLLEHAKAVKGLLNASQDVMGRIRAALETPDGASLLAHAQEIYRRLKASYARPDFLHEEPASWCPWVEPGKSCSGCKASPPDTITEPGLFASEATDPYQELPEDHEAREDYPEYIDGAGKACCGDDVPRDPPDLDADQALADMCEDLPEGDFCDGCEFGPPGPGCGTECCDFDYPLSDCFPSEKQKISEDLCCAAWNALLSEAAELGKGFTLEPHPRAFWHGRRIFTEADRAKMSAEDFGLWPEEPFWEQFDNDIDADGNC